MTAQKRTYDIEEHLDEIRAQYSLTDHWVFLNTGDQAMPGNYWLKAMRDFLDFQERGRMEDIPSQDIATHPFLLQAYFEAVERSARLIHADPEEVTLAYRPMHVCNLVVNDLLTFKPGDNIVFPDMTYPSLPYVFQGVRDRLGVELRCVKNVQGETRMEDLAQAVDDRTKLVALCRTTPFCGFTYDMKEVCRIAHAHGAYVFDDAFQAIGAIDVDVHQEGIDFVTTGSYKWQCGPEGAGFFYIRKDLIPKFQPRFRNYLAAKLPRGLPFTLADHDNVADWSPEQNETAEKFSLGAVSGPSVFGWLATLKFLDKLGMKNIEKRVRHLGQYLVGALQESGLKIVSPTAPSKMHGMVTYTTGSYERDVETYQRLSAPPIGKKPVKLSIRGLGGVCGLRATAHFFNTEEEIDYFIRAQSEFLASKKKS